MTWDTDRVLRATAIGFACTTAFTTAVSIRDDLPGRPLGVGVPLSVPTALLVGWGAAVAAPWPMPVAALMAAFRAGGENAGSGAALVCAGLGIAGITGLLIEPNTFDRQAWTPANQMAIASGFVSCGSLAAAGLRHWQRKRRAEGTAAQPVARPNAEGGTRV